MKQTSQTLCHTNFTFSKTGRLFRDKPERYLEYIQQQIHSKKNLFKSLTAAAGVGSLFLLSIYMFLTQLAKYGW
jgi:hypothetical protein